jgi:hypothetical protein
MRPARLLLLLSFLAISMAIFSSCEKEVKIDLSDGPTQLVVNGQIEMGGPPLIVLTRSIGYFSKVDLTTLQNSFIHNADVQVSNGIRTVRLREYNIDTGGTAKFYFYSVDTADPSAFSFVGEANHFYTLTIASEGKTYTSTTKIPAPRPIDSMAAVAPAQPPTNAPTAMQLMVWYSDPDTPGNAVRYFTRRNSEQFYPGPNSVFDDQVVNGVKRAQFPLEAGSSHSDVNFSDSSGYVFRGDTVTLKWSAIDRGVFNFYQTYEYSIGTVGNPFSSPINVMTNISGGALGVWAGYGSSYYTIVVPK